MSVRKQLALLVCPELQVQKTFTHEMLIKEMEWTRGRKPSFWNDPEVRDFIILQHRKIEIKTFCCRCVERFGVKRTPSKSAVQRLWGRIDKIKLKYQEMGWNA